MKLIIIIIIIKKKKLKELFPIQIDKISKDYYNLNKKLNINEVRYYG